MSFTYGAGSNPMIDYPRMLISDTQYADANGTPIYVFEDSEIMAAYNIVGNVFQSSMFFSPPAGQYIPATPINYYRVAATLLDCLASNKAKLASVIQLLDVKLDPSKAAQELRNQAKEYRDADDNSGAFMIIEQVNDVFSFRDRFWSQVQRLQQGIGS